MDFPEGATPLDADELEGLKFAHIQSREELNQVEQANIQEGFKWLAKQGKKTDFLSREFIVTLHQKLFGQVWSWAGTFRTTEKNIGIDPISISTALQNLSDDTRYWIEQSTYTREEFAARFHHRLVCIHPFPNGNGRFARIMTDIVLVNYLNEPGINWGANALLSDNQHRDNYIQALRAADKHDYTQLIQFMTE